MQIESFTTGLLLLSPLTHFNPVCSLYLVAAAKHCKFECKKKSSLNLEYFFHFPALNIQALTNTFATTKCLRNFYLLLSYIEGDASNFRLTKVHFPTLSSHFFAKTEVQTVILRCWTGLYLYWFKSYDIKRKYFLFHFFSSL